MQDQLRTVVTHQPNATELAVNNSPITIATKQGRSLFLLESNDASLRELETRAREEVSPKLLEWKSWWARGNLSARILFNRFVAMDCRCLPGKSES